MDDQINSTETAEPSGIENRPVQAAQIVLPRNAGKSGYVPKKPRLPRPPVKIEDEDEEGFLKRNLAPIIIATIVLTGGGWVAFHLPSGKSFPVQHAPEQIIKISLPPPPPPPPPKVQPPPPKDVKQPEQAPAEKPADKPMEKPKPAEKPPEGLGTNIKGNGPGMAGLGSSGNGMLGGTGSGPGGGGSQWGWYAGQVQARIADALRKNGHTSSATLNIEVKVWPDATGRIGRAQLVGSTGDRILDDAIKNEVLTGLQMQEPPPADMPTPILLRINARRPN